MYPSLMRAWNPALSLRTTVCPVEDSSPRWSNSHALTRDPRGGGRHSPGTRKCSDASREERRGSEEEAPRRSTVGPIRHSCRSLRSRVASNASQRIQGSTEIRSRDQCERSRRPVCVSCTREGSTAADRSSSVRDGESRVTGS